MPEQETALDLDTIGLIGMRDKAQAWELPEVDRRIHARCEAVRAGIARVSPFIQAALGKLNRRLRARFDLSAGTWDHSDGCLIIEEFVPAFGAWLKTCDWKLDEAGNPVSLSRMLEILHEADCSNEDYETKVQKDREAAAKRRAQNEKAATERVMAAIDSLSSKQITQFLQAERALRTGETIIAHGDDLRFLENAYRNTQHEIAAAQEQGKQLQDSAPMMPHRKRRLDG